MSVRDALVFASALLCAACQDRAPIAAVAARTQGGAALHWATRSVVLKPVVSGARRDSEPLLVRALASASGAWNRALGGCGAPRLEVASPDGLRPQWRQDHVSELVLHESSFCPPDAVDESACHAPGVHATTRLYPYPDPGGPRDGELSEADIAINGVEFRWSLDGTEPGTLSLTTLLLHELGHALGLAHSCQMGLAEHGASGLPDCVSIHPQTPLMHPAALERLGSSRTAPSKAEAALVCASHAPRSSP